MIPEIDIGPLFADDPQVRRSVDRQIGEAAHEIGFLSVHGAPDPDAVGAAQRRSLLRLFSISEDEQRKLWKKNFAPEHPNLYRGWFPLETGEARSRQGFELGPDLIRELPEDGTDDLLYEPSVFPPEAILPGWRQDAANYYRAIEKVGFAILGALSRSLGIPEAHFRNAFQDGISTLRLLHYPGRDPNASIPLNLETHFMDWQGERREIVCGGHVDSGLVTVLGQCDVSGLQAQARDGAWVDVPPRQDGFVINFGGLLARWTGGRVRATMHRVLSDGSERFSVPFFFEPRPGTVISPLPLAGIQPFEPFQYGDYMWATTTRFAENYGLEHLRPRRAPYRDPFADPVAGSR